MRPANRFRNGGRARSRVAVGFTRMLLVVLTGAAGLAVASTVSAAPGGICDPSEIAHGFGAQGFCTLPTTTPTTPTTPTATDTTAFPPGRYSIHAVERATSDPTKSIHAGSVHYVLNPVAAPGVSTPVLAPTNARMPDYPNCEIA
jgi:hypothetical protein